jgi:predicted ATPase/class 3 adenylate cyclase
MTELPSGTVTFLFTDLEGSTRLWEQHPEAMKAALARHDEILRDAIAAHGGHVVKMTGDGVHAAFATADRAVVAAVAAQSAFVDEAWFENVSLRIRMGVHTGAADLRDGDYYGTAVNKAARLMSAANGGQILVSLATEELVRDGLRDGVSLDDLGEHRLRDLSRPERVFGVTAPGLGPADAPLRSLDAYPTNLPIQLSSFVGRDDELIAAQKALTLSRMVTLTGVGGSGKTRLSIQVAADALPQYADGAWLCELASATDADVLVQVVAASLGVSPRAGSTIEGSVLGFLQTRQLLLLLDNCEHLLEAAGRLAETLLRGCPGLRILATSREGLAIDGERVLPLRSMDLPPASTSSADEVAASDAARLFAERAESARPGFTIDAANAVQVAEVCRRLDGMPLAIELAAARVAVMGPGEIASLLDERFRLLTGGRRTAVERHQTLRATVEWSYSLLDERDRVVFERLGVFSGSFDIDAAVDVVASDDVERWDVLESVASLVAKSMIVDEEPVEGSTRYSMLETLRQYARERLDERGEIETWRRRHAQCFSARAERIGRELQGPDELAWRTLFDADLDNIRSAVLWGCAASDPKDAALALRAIAALSLEVIFTRTAGIGSWAVNAMHLVDDATAGIRTAVLAGAAWDAFNRGDYDGTVALATSALRDGVAADCPVPSWAHSALSLGLSLQGDADGAHAAIEDGVRVLDERGPRAYEYTQLVVSAVYTDMMGGNDVAARAYSRDGLEIARTLRNPSLLTTALSAYAQVWWREDPDGARAALDEAIELMRRGAGDAVFATTFSLSALMHVGSEPVQALHELRESFVYSYSVGDQISIVTSTDRAVRVLGHLDRPHLVGVLLGVLEGPHRALSSVTQQERADGHALAQAIHVALGDEEYQRAIALGTAMPVNDVYAFAVDAIDTLLRELENDDA